MELKIKALFDCVLEVNMQNYEMLDNVSFVKIKMQDGEQVALKFYPTKKSNQIAYFAHIFFNDELSVICPYVKIISISKDEAILDFLPFEIHQANFYKETKENLLGFELKCLFGEINYFCVNNKNVTYNCAFVGRILHHEFLIVFENPALKVKTEQEQWFFVFNKEKQKFDKFCGEVVIFDDGNFEITEKIGDFAKHALCQKYKYENGELICFSTELMFLNLSPKLTDKNKIIPFAFLQAVKVKNFMLAKGYLCEKLSSKVSGEMLNDYFGDFDKIEPYFSELKSNEEYVCLILQNKGKIFKFKITEKKIEEIDYIEK